MKCYLHPLSWDSSFFLVKTLLPIGCSNTRDLILLTKLDYLERNNLNHRCSNWSKNYIILPVGANIVNYLLPAANTLCDSNTCKNLTCTWIVYIYNDRNIIEIMLFIKLLTS